MRSSIQFFMAKEDEESFLSFVAPMIDSTEQSSERQVFLIVGNDRIQFYRSKVVGDILESGSLGIADPQARAEGVYKKARNWLRQNFDNSLTVRNVNIPGSKEDCPTFWLGCEAGRWLQASDSRVLKQFADGNTRFEVKPAHNKSLNADARDAGAG